MTVEDDDISYEDLLDKYKAQKELLKDLTELNVKLFQMMMKYDEERVSLLKEKADYWEERSK